MNSPDTAFVLVSDNNYHEKARQTIIDLRIKGEWLGDIVYITIDFDLTSNFKDYYNVIEAKFDSIDKEKLVKLLPEGGFKGWDGRELNKMNQWEKLQVFDDYFRKWKRIIFVDAAMRILDSVEYLLELEYENSILMADDGKHMFINSIYDENKEMVDKVIRDFGEEVKTQTGILNGLWIYDTKILDIVTKVDLINGMYEYPICKANEMTLMQLFFVHKHKLWKKIPDKASNGKYLFAFSDYDYPDTTWRDFCLIKYPVTL